jgi:RNA polymerase sigma-70 factor (ECF subfamily)
MNLSLALRSWLNIEESNESLMLKYGQTDDVKYLKELITRLDNDLYHFMSRQADTDFARDLCQQTWLKVIDNRRSYSDTGSFKAWLYQIARRSMIDELRKNNKWHWEMCDEVAVETDFANLLHQYDLEQAFDIALTSLPFLQKEAFILQQEGLSLREIAAVTHSELETIKTRLRYARQSLKSLLSNMADHSHE